MRKACAPRQQSCIAELASYDRRKALRGSGRVRVSTSLLCSPGRAVATRKCHISTTATEHERPDIRILEIRSEVHHRYARTEVYSVVVNPAEESLEVIFKTVLPDEAFVSSFAITVGGRVYPARVEGREEARA
ncbi:Inter-alpha-trypsin inhibitor heavy chain H4, partial [Gryllus bimaculatus]